MSHVDPRVSVVRDALWRGMPWRYLGDDAQAAASRQLDESCLAEQILDALDAYAKSCGRGGGVSSSRVDEVVQAAREFVDAFEKDFGYDFSYRYSELDAAYGRMARALDELKRLEHSENL